MTINAKFIEHSNYLEIIYSDKKERTYEFLDELYKVYRKTGLTKFLIDVTNSPGPFKNIDRFKIGEKLAELFGTECKIAAIEKAEKINKLAENTAVNRGVDLYVTADKKSALKWLLGA